MVFETRLFGVASLATAVLLIAAQPTVAQTMALPGKFAVSTSGAATYTIPIAVPPGSAGVVPSLSLEYSSHDGDGIMGIGWALGGLPSIVRCPQTFAQDGMRGGVNFDANDRFCMEGQRLVVVSGSYGGDGAEYRTEIDSFSRIISHGSAGNGPAWFEVHSKSGQRMEFGHSTDSLILAQGKNTARTWAVNKVSDTKGNYFTVSYTNDATNGQFYPIEIDYTGNSAVGLSPYNKVQFVYAARPDIVTLYQAGSLVQTSMRLTDIKTFAGAMLVNDYQLAYMQSTVSNRSRLTAVTACSGSGSCLPATTFSWPDDNGTLLTPPVYWQAAGNWNGWSFAKGDVNGDGKTDLIVYAADASSWRTYIALALGDGTFSSPVSWAAPGNWNGWSFTTGDVNGDGKLDLILNANDASSWRTWVALGNGDGTFSSPVHWQAANDWTGWSFATGDVNGDGKLDLISYVVNDVVGWRTWVALSRGDGTFSSPVNWLGGGNDWKGWSFTTGDVNGDGKLDLILHANDRSGWRTYVALGNGDGTFSSPVPWSAGWGNWTGWSFFVATNVNIIRTTSISTSVKPASIDCVARAFAFILPLHHALYAMAREEKRAGLQLHAI